MTSNASRPKAVLAEQVYLHSYVQHPRRSNIEAILENRLLRRCSSEILILLPLCLNILVLIT